VLFRSILLDQVIGHCIWIVSDFLWGQWSLFVDSLTISLLSVITVVDNLTIYVGSVVTVCV